MFMFCGYESVTLKSRSSPFCSEELFKEHEFHSFGYWNDLVEFLPSLVEADVF